MKPIILSFLLGVSSACSVTSQPAQLVEIGLPSKLDLLKRNLKPSGPIHFQKVVAANWAVDRDGLINLNDPKAKAAGLKEGDEDIQIYFYVIDHPQYGRYLIDSGVEERLKSNPEEAPIGSIVAKFMNIKKLLVHQSTQEWLQKNPQPLKGVILTHMHLDHIMGIPDIGEDIPIFIGPNESTHKNFPNMFVRGSTDGFLEGQRTLSELHFTGNRGPGSPQMIDFFGDGSFYIISVPGHTVGSLAFAVSTQSGIQLITGDSCHTRWGWENGVTPGSFTEDQKGNQESLDFLKTLAVSLPGVKVHLGHQSATATSKLEAY